jgi:hypothetical protein
VTTFRPDEELQARRELARSQADSEQRRSAELWDRGTAKPDKLAMEEARLLLCHECGFSRGRHASSCSVAPVRDRPVTAEVTASLFGRVRADK